MTKRIFIDCELGQSNIAVFGNAGAYSGWTTSTALGVAAERIWNASAQALQTYLPGSNSDGFGSGSWGVEARLSLLYRTLVPQMPVVWLKYWQGATGLARQTDPAIQDWSPFSTGKMFDLAMAQLAACKAALVADGWTPIVRRVIWLGNETDATTLAAAQATQRDLIDLDAALRIACGNDNLQFIVVRVPYETTDLWIAESQTGGVNLDTAKYVRSAQEKVGNRRHNTWVSADGLAYFQGHYTTASAVTLGDRIFDRISQISD